MQITFLVTRPKQFNKNLVGFNRTVLYIIDVMPTSFISLKLLSQAISCMQFNTNLAQSVPLFSLPVGSALPWP